MKHLLLSLIALVLGAGTGWAQTLEPASTRPTTGPTTAPVTPAHRGKVAVIPIQEAIDDYTFKKLQDRIASAKADGADTLVLKLNTPGGTVSAAFDITRLLKKESDNFHIVAYVDEMAYSAGTMIAVACDEIVMQEGSMIGDCAPILPTQTGLAEITGANRAKFESPLVAEFEDSAKRNGYDPLLLRSFVQYQLIVFVVDGPDGQRRFVQPDVKDQLIKDGWRLATDIKNPIDDELTLLTTNAETAAALKLSKGTYESVQAFVESRGWTVTREYHPTNDEKFINLLSHPSLRTVLSVVFMLSLYLAMNKPGTGIFEALLISSGAVLFGVPLLTGYAGWLEISMILLGIALLAFELFVIPGFGVAGISGLVLLLLGAALTFVPSEAPGLPDGPSIFPQLQQTQESLKEGLIYTVIGMVVSFGLWLWLSRYLPKLPYFNRLVLTTTVGSTPESDDPTREAVESTWPHVGAKGVAATDLRPGGMGRFYDTIINDDRNVDVISDHGFVAAGDAIIVRSKRGTEIMVRKV